MLINNPEDFELKSPPIVESLENDCMCTFNRKVLSVANVKADGNGAYCRKGGSKKCYFFNGSFCTEAHKVQDSIDLFYVNNRSCENQTWKKQFVDKESIFFVKRYYRYNKLNSFNQIIVEVQTHDQTFLDYFYVFYRRNKDKDSGDCESIAFGRHGNAKSPHAGLNFNFHLQNITCFSCNQKSRTSYYCEVLDSMRVALWLFKQKLMVVAVELVTFCLLVFLSGRKF